MKIIGKILHEQEYDTESTEHVLAFFSSSFITHTKFGYKGTMCNPCTQTLWQKSYN